jgi:acetylornithine/N-succinyldiaminopimelate aminotransferase
VSIGERGRRSVLPTYPDRPLAFVRGQGTTLWAEDGTAYLDLVAGLAVVSLGHAHPAPIEAFARQAATLGHVSNLFWSEPGVALAERLLEVCEMDGGVFFCNSGAEANEAAIKLARRRGRARGGPDKHQIVCLEGSFHGRTLATLQATWAREKKVPFEPLPEGFTHVPPDDRDALRVAVNPGTAAILLEPVQGEGGVNPASAEYFQGVRRLCDEREILFVADEVQTGFARTGRMFAVEHSSVQPDIMVMAKGIDSGFPISAIGARADLMARWNRGAHGGTYGANPIGCAAAIATIDVIFTEQLVTCSAARGGQLMEGLRALQSRHTGIGDVRGLGLMVAAELTRADGAPDAARTTAVMEHCVRENHLILMSCGADGNVIRFMPPLVVSEAQIDDALAAFDKALAATSCRNAHPNARATDSGSAWA